MSRIRATESDRIPLGAVLLAGAVTLAIFGLGIFWAGRLVVRGDGALQPAPALSTPAGMIERTPYGVAQSAQRKRAAERAALSRWEWVDRDHGLVHMPIEDAMKRVENGERP